jgi:hypothetical protein
MPSTKIGMKTVISVRLSQERLAQIDAAARRLGMTRSAAIDTALRIFPDLLNGDCELQFVSIERILGKGADAKPK